MATLHPLHERRQPDSTQAARAYAAGVFGNPNDLVIAIGRDQYQHGPVGWLVDPSEAVDLHGEGARAGGARPAFTGGPP